MGSLLIKEASSILTCDPVKEANCGSMTHKVVPQECVGMSQDKSYEKVKVSGWEVYVRYWVCTQTDEWLDRDGTSTSSLLQDNHLINQIG